MTFTNMNKIYRCFKKNLPKQVSNVINAGNHELIIQSLSAAVVLIEYVLLVGDRVGLIWYTYHIIISRVYKN
jgi:hypothetical protein